MCHKKEDMLSSEGAREGKWAEDGGVKVWVVSAVHEYQGTSTARTTTLK